MKKQVSEISGTVDASPVKSFFVNMLTRDISLHDAILDLLDNCVDGIHRMKKKASGKDKPYAGYRAEITFNVNEFIIHDNCGGIPWDLHAYAFRMGRADGRKKTDVGTVGVYGIGMKRAIFKMGRHCLISTKAGRDNYEIEITEDWMNDERQWAIPVKKGRNSMAEDGSTIYISSLLPGIANSFGPDKEAFASDFIERVESQYAFIIHKGFEVIVNGVKVKPKPIELHFDNSKNKEAVRPFIYRAEVDGVRVFLAVGFSRPIPTQEDVSAALDMKRHSTEDAGWTVVCNERAVLYCDRSELTGWGEAGVPDYHTQFIAISGIVEFQSEDPSKLPTTTTKRGIDASSPLYLQVKNKMREGMKIFIDFTNKWKTREKEAKTHIKAAGSVPLTELKHSSSTVHFTPVSKKPGGEQYRPSLPLPPLVDTGDRRISFVRKVGEIKEVGRYLLQDEVAAPARVGEACFESMLSEARK